MASLIRCASRRTTSATKLLSYSTSGASKQQPQINTKTFENGKSFLLFHKLISAPKFYSTNALAKFQFPEEAHERPGAESEEEVHESQDQNIQKQEQTVQIIKKKNRSPDEVKLLEEKINQICQIVEKKDKSVEESLNQMSIHVTPELVSLVVSKITSPHPALRFFRWAKTHPGFKSSSVIYDKLINMVGSCQDFETMKKLLTSRIVEGCFNSTKTFSFATVWRNDPEMLKKVAEMINKLDKFQRRNAYDMLIAALCKEDYVDAGLNVLQRMLSAGCVPSSCTFHPFVSAYSRNNQIAKVYEVFQVMKERDCIPDTNCYNFVLRNLCQNEQFSDAVELLGTMVKSSGCKPNSITYDILILAACRAGKVEGAHLLLNRMKEDKLKPLYCTYTNLITGFLQAGDFEKAYDLVNQESGKDLALDFCNYNCLVRSCSKMGKVQEARDVLMEMKAKNLNPNNQLYDEVLHENKLSQTT